MRSALLRLFAYLSPVFLGLATSALLLVDYLRVAPVICAEGGCGALKHSPFAHLLGLPTPLFGVLGFALIGALFLARGPGVRRVLIGVAGAGAAAGIGFIALQVRLGAFCPFCLTSDVCAVLALGAAFVRDHLEWDPHEAWKVRGTALTLLVFAFALPSAFAAVKQPIVPDVIALEQAKAPRGRVPVVDFVDFECPFCRMTHESLHPLLEEHRDRVFVVRKLVPLTRIHPHALDAARAACCGERLGKGDAMAEALFAAPVEELTPEGCAKLALELGLDADAYRRCLADPGTDARVQADRATFDKATIKGDGLPLLWIGADKLMGAQDVETLKSTLEGAIARAGS